MGESRESRSHAGDALPPAGPEGDQRSASGDGQVRFSGSRARSKRSSCALVARPEASWRSRGRTPPNETGTEPHAQRARSTRLPQTIRGSRGRSSSHHRADCTRPSSCRCIRQRCRTCRASLGQGSRADRTRPSQALAFSAFGDKQLRVVSLQTIGSGVRWRERAQRPLVEPSCVRIRGRGLWRHADRSQRRKWRVGGLDRAVLDLQGRPDLHAGGGGGSRLARRRARVHDRELERRRPAGPADLWGHHRHGGRRRTARDGDVQPGDARRRRAAPRAVRPDPGRGQRAQPRPAGGRVRQGVPARCS